MIRLAVRVARDRAELVLADLLALSPAGLEERDLGAAGVEYALYGAPGELPGPMKLQALAGEALVEVSSEEVADDWGERWKAWHRPVEVGSGERRVRVRPPWELRAGEGLDLVIDPGQAFGTGAHATTRLCLELLLETEPEEDGEGEGGLADWGAGSGVLAIVAARLGWAPVLACDHDPAAVEAARANAVANEAASVAVRRVDLRAEPVPWAPTVTANLARGLLLELAARVPEPPRRLIASGLLREEGDEVAGAWGRRGLRERERRAEAEWLALRLER